MQRWMSIDVCDYTGQALCNLYDSSNDMPGQATDVFVHTERNGYKEIRFNLPSVLPDGEPNYRMDFLVSDYRIKTQIKKSEEEIEIDWFLISESRIQHDNFSKNSEIKAKHISSLLNTKNLELEFSDEDGNNTGTIGQIAATILEGTGWHLGDVRHFYEETKYGYGQKVEKVRSFTASSQTGAFKMMTDLCELFDAKPLYHGYGKYIEDGKEKWGRTVDIIPINPFSKDLEEGSVPQEVLEGEDVLELYYDKNVKNITRTLNTDNIVTKLSAYGSYGDRNGLCSLQEAAHAELTFNEPVGIGEYYFEWQDGRFYFTSTAATDSLKWSALDFSSRSYVYDGTNLYKVYKEQKGDERPTKLTTVQTIVKNYVPYIMDFTYYDSVGLLDDNMLRVIANHQTNIPAKHIAATEASIALAAEKEKLMRTASAGEGFLMLDISASSLEDGNFKLYLNKTTYSDGVIYRSDYDEAKRNYFSWYVASGIKLSGEAIAGKGAIVYIVHQGSPTKWEKAYVKYIGNLTDNYYRDSLGNTYSLHNKLSYEDKDHFPVNGQDNIIYVALDTGKFYVWFNDDYQDLKASDYTYGLNEFDEPSTLTLWSTEDTWHSGDKVYLFSADSIAGLFGPREDAVLSNRKGIEETTKTVTEIHPMYFITNDDPIPSVDACLSSYGWYYHTTDSTFEFGDLHFCWGANGELGWSNVYVSRDDNNPEEISVLPNYGYYYSIKRKWLYKADGLHYRKFEDTGTEKDIATAFETIVRGCINQDVLTKGVKEEYYYNQNTQLPIGNYAFKNKFDNYWLFTTDKVINPQSGDQLRYKYNDKVIWQDNDEKHIIRAIEYSFDVLSFPVSNELDGAVFAPGNYADQTFPIGDTYQISNNIYTYENVSYQFNLPAESIVVCLDANNRVKLEATTSPFTTPANTTHVRIVCPNWKQYHQYAVGDIVIVDSLFYRCKTAHTSTDTFDDIKWDIVTSYYLRVENYSNVLFSKNKLYTVLPCSTAGDRIGMSYLMDQFVSLAHEAYEVKLPALKQAQKEITDAMLLLSNTLGDMYREGVWRKEDYVEEDISKLYADALDNLKEISHPEASYDISFLDLYGSNPITEDSEETPWPDIEITYAAHLVDKEIDINKWAYIDSIDKCYDQPWKTELEINTNLSMIGQQSFTDVLAKIAEVANETKANQGIYKRASALTSSGQMAAERLEGAIQTNKLLITGSTSNWYTDPKGNIVFESADGSSAMMLSGKGWAVADSKDASGDWDFRYMATGKGLTADAIYTGYLSAERIEAGSITTDKLSASIGQDLDISSNTALNLFATTDGFRPAGSLLTQHPGEGDSWIAIGAKKDNNPAYIDVKSGGLINLYGGSKINIESQGELNLYGGSKINIESQGELNLSGGSKINIESQGELNLSGATMNLTSQGKLTIDGGTIDIKSTGVLLVDSENFSIKKNTTTGKYDVTIKGNGQIAGFTIGNANNIDYMYAGQTTSVDSNTNGVYLGTNGINVGGKLKFSADGTTAKLNVNASDIALGDITGFTTLSGKISDMDSKTDTAQSTADEAQSSANTAQASANAAQSAAEAAQATANEAQSAASAAQLTADKIADGRTPVPKVETTGIKIYKDASNKGHIEIGSTGSIDMLANSSLTFATTSSNSAFVLNNNGVSIGSAKDISLAANGTFTINSGNFKIKSDGSVELKGTIKATALYIGATSSSDGTAVSMSASNGFVVTSGTTVDASKIKTIAGIKVDSSGVVISSSTTNVASAVQTAASIKVDTSGVVISSTLSDVSGAVKSAAGIKVDSTGVVISSSTSDTSAAVKNAAGIKVDTSGVVISSSTTSAATAVKNAAGITVDSSGVVISSTATASTAVRSAAGISIDATTGVVISSTGTAGTTSTTKISAITLSNNKIDMSCTNVGDSSSTGVYISPSSLTVKSTGDVDFSAARSISLKANSITMSAISDRPNMSNYYDHKTGVTISDGSVDVRADDNNFITINNSGITMKGHRLSFIETTDSGDTIERTAWGRDDIVVMNPNISETSPDKWRKSVDRIMDHMNALGKTDWVLIRPYYDASISYLYSNAVYYNIAKDPDYIATIVIPQEGTQASFGDNSSYTYTLTFDMATSNNARRIINFYLSNVSDFSSQTVTIPTTPSYFVNAVADSRDINNLVSSEGLQPPRYAAATLTFRISGTINLCKENAIMYFKATNPYINAGYNISNIRLTCTSNFTTGRVPCAVYYIPE